MSASRTSSMLARRATLLPSAAPRRASSVLRPHGGALRPNSTSSQAAKSGAKAGAPAGLIGGLAGGGLVLLGVYGYYRTSGLATVVDTASQTKQYLASTASKLRDSAPEPNQALDWLHETAAEYAKFVPGGKRYVDAAFKDIDVVRQAHGEEVNAIVQDAYARLQKLAKRKDALSWDAATQGWTILEDAVAKLGSLAADASDDILKQHPQLQSAVGGGLDRLRQMSDQYGPEARKQYADVQKQVKEIAAGGFSLASADKIRKLVAEKSEELKKLGDAAWDKSAEAAKPYLDRNPQIKELIERNKDALKSGDTRELWSRVKLGANSGELREYLEQAAQKGKQAVKGAGESTGLSSLLSGEGADIGSLLKSVLPAGVAEGASEILPKLQKLQSAAEKHGDEAERIARETYDDLRQVLGKRLQEVEGLAGGVKEDAKKELRK